MLTLVYGRFLKGSTKKVIKYLIIKAWERERTEKKGYRIEESQFKKSPYSNILRYQCEKNVVSNKKTLPQVKSQAKRKIEQM